MKAMNETAANTQAHTHRQTGKLLQPAASSALRVNVAYIYIYTNAFALLFTTGEAFREEINRKLSKTKS